jgi:hypothetical protein
MKNNKKCIECKYMDSYMIIDDYKSKIALIQKINKDLKTLPE